MNKIQLIQVDVKNDRSLSKLGVVTVFLTPEQKAELDKEKTKNGEMLSDLFARGMALRGFKHLVEKIRKKTPKAKIVFTHNKTSKTENEIFIKYDEYKKATSSKFFTFYRETGLDAASYFLNNCFPEDFEYDSSKVSESDVRKFEKNFDQVISRVPKKRKNAKLPKILGKRIQKQRKLMGLTQEDVAFKVGISRAYMGYIEQGRNAPSLEILEKIAKAIKTSPKDFF